MPTPKSLKQRREAAKREYELFQPMREDAFRYAIPYRRSASKSGASQGESRVDDVFDSTAMDSAFRFAGKFVADIWPEGQENFQLEAGPIVRNQKEKDQLNRELGGVTSVLQAFFDDGDFDLALHEMALELNAGTGAMLLNSTADPAKLWEPTSVSTDEILLEGAANGKVTGVFWCRRMTYRQAFETWPDGTFSETMKTAVKEKAEGHVDINVDTVLNPPKNGRPGYWTMTVWCKEDEPTIYETQRRTAPWLTPRYFRVPGETWGRGPAMLAMPTIKTTNTAARLQLMAAAIAMMGIYTARDDGVFNPDLSPVEPGVFWKVASNAGGAMGPSVSKFPDPRLDLSNLILSDMRSSIKATMLDENLPADSSAVKSATEILQRVQRAANDQRGAFGRLVKEIVIPAVQGAAELAYNKGLIKDSLTLDQLLIRVRVKSPLAIAREADRLQKILNWLQMVLAVCGQTQSDPNRIAKIEQMLLDAGSALGIDPKYIVTSDERQAMDDAESQKAAIAQAAALATGGELPGPAPAGSTAVAQPVSLLQ